MAGTTPSLIVKQLDTYPAWQLQLNDDDDWIDLSTASAVKLIGKAVSGVAEIGPGSCTVLATESFTCDTTLNSNVLSSVSSFTGIDEGVTISVPGIPTPAVVQSFNQTAGTITCVMAPSGTVTLANATPANATATATGVAGVLNKGSVSYTPTTTDTGTAAVFNVEAAIHWDSGGTMIQKVPNAAANNPQIEVDPDVLGGAE